MFLFIILGHSFFRVQILHFLKMTESIYIDMVKLMLYVVYIFKIKIRFTDLKRLKINSCLTLFSRARYTNLAHTRARLGRGGV